LLAPAVAQSSPKLRPTGSLRPSPQTTTVARRSDASATGLGSSNAYASIRVIAESIERLWTILGYEHAPPVWRFTPAASTHVTIPRVARTHRGCAPRVSLSSPGRSVNREPERRDASTQHSANNERKWHPWGDVESASRSYEPKPADCRGARPAVDPRGPDSDRRRHFTPRRSGRAAFASVARGRNAVTELRPCQGTQLVPRSGLCGSRFHTRTTHAPASSWPQSEDESSGQMAPFAGVAIGLLTTLLAFEHTHEHRLSAVQPRGSNLCVRRRTDSSSRLSP